MVRPKKMTFANDLSNMISSCTLIRITLAVCLLSWWIPLIGAYYAHNKCFGTGDCIIAAGYLGGGFSDEYHKWLIECSDGESMIGIYDSYKQFFGISQIWCFFMFPLKPPGNGIYPYFPICNVRNFTQAEWYCYDKYFPEDTVDTFVTGIYSAVSFDPVQPTLQKCCKTPYPYKLDYNRCQWKYTHDKAGEHYDGYWIVKCDTNFVITGMGQAMNPWDNQMHWVWVQDVFCERILGTRPRTIGQQTKGRYKEALTLARFGLCCLSLRWFGFCSTHAVHPTGF